MKILYSCMSRSWGGMEMITLTFVKKLHQKGFKVELLCIAESRMHIEANNLGIIIHSVKSSGYINPASILKVTGIIRKAAFDLIHMQASKDLWIIVPALKILKSKIPLFFTKQVGSFIQKKDFLHNFLYNRVNLAFAISTVIKKNLIETTALTRDKIEILFNGVDVKRFDTGKADRKKIRKEFSISDDELLIGMLARFSPGKGHEEFIGAAKKLSAKHSNLKFIIVGEASRGEDAYADSVKKLAKDTGLTNIIFSGFRGDTPDILYAMDIFVFPSHSEAFGIALIEAMAMKLPTVCSNADGVLDIALHEETSLLFENKNTEDLAEKVSIIISDPEKRKRFGENARRRVIDKFDIELITEQLIKFYRRSLNNKN